VVVVVVVVVVVWGLRLRVWMVEGVTQYHATSAGTTEAGSVVVPPERHQRREIDEGVALAHSSFLARVHDRQRLCTTRVAVVADDRLSRQGVRHVTSKRTGERVTAQ
jgi:hypothetical protein